MLKLGLLRPLAVPLAAIVLATGCLGTGKPRPARIVERPFEPDTSGNVAYVQAVPGTQRAVRSTNYQVGVKRVATAGEPMLEVRNYTADVRVVAAVARGPFRQLCKKPGKGEPVTEKLACRSGRMASLRGNEGDRFEVAGAVTEAGTVYYMVRLPASDGAMYLAVDANGRLKPGRYAAWSAREPEATPIGVPVRWQDTPAEMAGDSSLFRFETAESVAPGAGTFIHYELLYRGVTLNYRGMVFHLLYREFRSDATGVPLHEQALEFPAGISVIDVLGLRLRVHDVNESEIVFTVMSD